MDFAIRFFDILFSLIALIVLTPLFIPIIIILRFTGEGEIFYFQDRIGKNEKVFQLIKFATMLKDSAKLGTGEVTLANDIRVLPFGSFLRKTKINELPQLINILKGDISVIGPRPQTSKYYYAYLEKDREFISKVKPGLSGIGSVIFRDEEVILSKVNDPVSFDLNVITPYKGKLESWYVRNRSIFLYFKLIFLTIIVVLFSDINKYNNWFEDLPKPPKELEGLLR